jgi:hypothetical protein
LARYELRLVNEPLPPTSPTYILKVGLLEMDDRNTIKFKLHNVTTASSYNPYESLLAWLELTTATKCPAISNQDVYDRIKENSEYKARDLHLEAEEITQTVDIESECDGYPRWIYKKLVITEGIPTLTGEWRGFENQEDFQRLLDDFAKERLACPAFISVSYTSSIRCV